MIDSIDDAQIRDLLTQINTQGTQQYASWDANNFRWTMRSTAPDLWLNLSAKHPNIETARSVFSAWLSLVVEAVGSGRGNRWPETLLCRCFYNLIPEQLANYQLNSQVELLSKVWNLIEGLEREPDWIGQFVQTQLEDLKEINDLEGFLIRTLEPVLSPIEPAEWNGPFQHMVLKVTEQELDFLPGELKLIAPRVICVTDRNSDLQFGVLLRPDRQSLSLGQLTDAPTYHEGTSPPECVWETNRVTIHDHPVELDYFTVHHSSLAITSGFAVASAVDSQRLWIVESA